MTDAKCILWLKAEKTYANVIFFIRSPDKTNIDNLPPNSGYFQPLTSNRIIGSISYIA